MQSTIKKILLTCYVVTAASLDVTSEAAVTDALKQMAKNLMGYYSCTGCAANGLPLANGASGPEGFQWYEGGVMWGVVMEYIKITGDETYASTVVNALTEASSFKTSNFLGNNPAFEETVAGKWNDDILWYALPVATGGEVFGVDSIMPGGVSFHDLSDTTYKQVWGQWSDTLCGGGIYWSRNRQDLERKGYKSTITHGQQMILGGKLALLTGDNSYIEQGRQIYNWLKSSGIIRENYQVYDGVNDDKGCGVTGINHSYNAGFVAGGLAWLYKASGDDFFNVEANKVATASLQTFVKDNIFYDSCEENNPRPCDQNKATFKGSFIRGLGYVYEFTNDQALKDQIKTVLATSVEAMMKTCSDDFECGTLWLQGQPEESNVHFAMNSMELMTAYLKTMKASGAILTAPSTAPVVDTKEGSADRMGASLAIVSVMASLLI
jgi:mannan endo-1,6-alpha-mannosidase